MISVEGLSKQAGKYALAVASRNTRQALESRLYDVENMTLTTRRARKDSRTQVALSLAIEMDMVNASCPKCSATDRRLPAFLTDNLFRRLLRSPRKFVQRFIKDGQVVADLGCGPGFYSLPMAETVGGRGKVYAVDFDSKVIKKLSLKAQKRGLTSIIETYTGSAADVSHIPDASVDFVLANGLLCCMTDHLGGVKEIKRILKPEGEAYISITRPWRKKDPRNVTEEEWERLLDFFTALKRGRSMIGNWAIVAQKPA